MTTVTIDRRDMEEARKASAFMGVECYFMDKNDDNESVSMVVMSDKPFELWYLARVMQTFVFDKLYA